VNRFLDRRWVVLALAITMQLLQVKVPSEATTVWPPMVAVLLVVFLYRVEIRAFRWTFLKQIAYLEAAFLALTQGIILQAVGIVIVQYGFAVQAPPVHIGWTPMVLVSAIVFSAILEEVLHRKIIFSFLDQYIGFWPAAAVSSAVFAIVHYNYSAYLGYFLLGLVWCRAYKKSGNIGVVITAHMAFNLIAFVAMWLRG
jgi:membrane protease YdiL (CAAX protease family)